MQKHHHKCETIRNSSKTILKSPEQDHFNHIFDNDNLVT